MRQREGLAFPSKWKGCFHTEAPNPRTIYLVWVMCLLFPAHHTQTHALTECEHASGKCDNDTDNVLREKAWIVLELQVGFDTYIRVNKVITVKLWYYL